MGFGEGPQTLTVDSDLVVGLGLLSVPACRPAPERTLVRDPNSRQEKGAIGEDMSHAIPSSLGGQDLPSFCPACVLGTEDRGLNSVSSLGKD